MTATVVAFIAGWIIGVSHWKWRVRRKHMRYLDVIALRRGMTL